MLACDAFYQKDLIKRFNEESVNNKEYIGQRYHFFEVKLAYKPTQEPFSSSG